jgi:hypothetical protein
MFSLGSSATLLLAASAVAVAVGMLPTRVDAQSAQLGAAAEDTIIRPFTFRASDEAIADLDRRIKGGHFAAWEQPELFTQELRTSFRTLR